MVPYWKIRRELETFRQQLHALPELLVGSVRQRWLDRRFPSNLKISQGDALLGSKVAIFLIFQPSGVPASVRFTCQYLMLKGFSVLLVCNSPISEKDRLSLNSCVWRFVERKNFGYDFGGYRDGIHSLWFDSVVPETLIILNDSVWFPLSSSESMLDAMERSAAQFVGALRHVDFPDADGEHAGIFLSYFFLIKRSVLLSHLYIDYWRDYISTSNKYLTVRRGERGFSRALFGAKVPSEGVYSRDRFLHLMESQSSEVLVLTLQYGAYTDSEFERERNELLAHNAKDDHWREQALDHIRSVSAKRNFHSSFCYASIGLLGIPLLKKNRGELQIRMRRQYVRAVKAGDLASPDEAVFEEIQRSL